MTITPEQLARELIEVVPIVMKEMRSQMRSRRTPDLTIPQFRTLAFIDRNKGASLSAAANHLGLTPPSTSRLVDCLIARGLVIREDHPDDRRRIRLNVTHLGSKILETSRRGTLDYLAEKLSRTNVDDRKNILKAMEAMRSVFIIDTETKAGLK